METNDTSARRTYDWNLAYFKIRITSKLCVALVYLVQTMARAIALPLDQSMATNTSKTLLIISLPFSFMITLIIAFEYLLFKKKGPGIVKYSNIIDLILYLCYMADWILVEISDLNRIQSTNPPSFKLGALYGFTAFSWRTLLVTFLVQKWQFKIIAPSVAILVATGYCIYYNPHSPGLVVARAITQLFYVILILYCEDKMKNKLMWTNIQQEKWMQINNVILNNIPENIMVLNLAGQVKFMSEYCKSFLKKCNSLVDDNDTKGLFKKIRDLNQQYETESSSSPSDSVLNIERLATYQGLVGDNAHESDHNTTGLWRIEILEDFIKNFAEIIKYKNLQEGQFLIYNGKLKMENNLPDKSIEVKISFVRHFENDYIILIFRDTTQRNLLVTLEETNKYKDKLLASVSHELRAPLNGNINLVESAVHSPKIPESIKENLLIPALRSSKFLLHIINDILDMSQINEKRLRLVFQSADLKETLKSCAQLVEIQAKKKGLELHVEVDPNISKNFNTDHIRVSQILLNLLTNAIKFTREGMVKLTAEDTPGTRCCKITVEDSGIGMSQENVKKLFSNYTNIDFEGRQLMNPTGVGLGLNIAYNLADMLAPKEDQGIRVISIPNQGSIFSFTVENKENEVDNDREKSEVSCEEVAEELTESKNTMVFEKLQTLTSSSFLPFIEHKSTEIPCSCPKVLIVDDNPFNIMALEAILNSLEIKCSSVYSGSDAIQKLLNFKCENKECKGYSVIFMDQEMPQMSGAETVLEIKRLQEEKLIPSGIRIIGCTAHKAKEEVDKFLSSGLEHCIYKPVSIAMIKDTLKELCIKC